MFSVMASTAGDDTSSPKNRVKILCSHGGKILPRPPDGQLKYIGGETRVVAVSRDINFSELMEKFNSLFEGKMVLKYQLIPEELDILVSVRCDEDLRHMINEYDRHESKSSENGGTPYLRAFLFPSNSNPNIVNQSHTISHNIIDTAKSLEHRYMDAINGTVHLSTPPIHLSTPPKIPTIIKRSSSVKSPSPIFSISSPCTSPIENNSPDGSYTINGINHEAVLSESFLDSFAPKIMKVNSSPSLVCVPQQIHGYNHHHHHHHHNQGFYQPSRTREGTFMVDVNGRLVSGLSMGRNENANIRMGHNPNWYRSTARRSRGSGGYVEECGGYRGGGIDYYEIN